MRRVHFEFSRGELGDLIGGWAGGPGDEVFDQAAGDRRCDQRVASRDGVDALDELLAAGVLEQEPARACAQRLEHVLVQIEGGEDQHRDRVRAVRPASRRVASRPSMPGMRMSIRTASGCSESGEVDGLMPSPASPTTSIPAGLEDHSEAVSDELLVVGDDHAEAASRGGEGDRGDQPEPASGSGSALIVPPSAVTR